MVPLDEHRSVLDLISILRTPVLVVAGTYVGTISHTLTGLEVLARRNLDILAVAVSESNESAASLEDTVESIGRFADAIAVIGIPRLPVKQRTPPADFRRMVLGDRWVVTRLRGAQMVRNGLKMALGVDRYTRLRQGLLSFAGRRRR